MMKNPDVFYRRELSEKEETILNYIVAHPRLTAEDIAGEFGHTEEAYHAIAHLTQHLYAQQDLVTGAITTWSIA